MNTQMDNIESYAAYTLDGNDCGIGLGAVEAASETAENNSKAIGRLLQLMHDRGKLSDDDVIKIIEGI